MIASLRGQVSFREAYAYMHEEGHMLQVMPSTTISPDHPQNALLGRLHLRDHDTPETCGCCDFLCASYILHKCNGII